MKTFITLLFIILTQNVFSQNQLIVSTQHLNLYVVNDSVSYPTPENEGKFYGSLTTNVSYIFDFDNCKTSFFVNGVLDEVCTILDVKREIDQYVILIESKNKETNENLLSSFNISLNDNKFSLTWFYSHINQTFTMVGINSTN